MVALRSTMVRPYLSSILNRPFSIVSFIPLRCVTWMLPAVASTLSPVAAFTWLSTSAALASLALLLELLFPLLLPLLFPLLPPLLLFPFPLLPPLFPPPFPLFPPPFPPLFPPPLPPPFPPPLPPLPA
ncbi:MAG: hypothetical protein EOQ50_13750 [Mesorhizobium sp.]|nr:MAG: hypothetical protein EOQ50_13750 [Mesorhizobium sp.]